MTKKILRQIKTVWFFVGMTSTWLLISMAIAVTATDTTKSFWTVSVLFSSMTLIILGLIDKMIISRNDTINM